jgi:hypothetical protein
MAASSISSQKSTSSHIFSEKLMSRQSSFKSNDSKKSGRISKSSSFHSAHSKFSSDGLTKKGISKPKKIELFSKKVKALFAKSTNPIDQKIITAAENIVVAANKDIYCQNGIHKQKKSVICGLASHLNNTEYAFKNSLTYFIKALNEFQESILDDADNFGEKVNILDARMSKLLKKYKIFYLGNTDLEKDLVVLRSLLSAHQSYDNSSNEPALDTQLKNKICTQADAIKNKLSTLLNSDSAYFNVQDLMYSSVEKIQERDDDVIKKYILDMEKSINCKTEDAGKSVRLPEGILNLIHAKAEEKINIFNNIFKFNQESTDNYEAKIDILTFMMNNNTKYPTENELTAAVVEFLKKEESMIYALGADLPIEHDANINNEGEYVINKIAEQAVDFFKRIKDYGISVQQNGEHFTAIVYDAKNNEFKLIDSLNNKDVTSNTNDVIQYLTAAKKGNGHVFTCVKRQEDDVFVHKLDSCYDLYKEHGII